MKKKVKFIYTSFFSILFILSGCDGIYENGDEMVASSLTVVDEISVDDLKTKLENEEPFYLIDVRRHTEFKKGYINEDSIFNMYLQTINIPRGVLEFKIGNNEFWQTNITQMPDKEAADIIIYCRSGKRGILATETLLKLGYKKVKNLKGGWNAWNSGSDGSDLKVKDAGCGG